MSELGVVLAVVFWWVRYTIALYVSSGIVWCGMVWYGMVWYGMVWYGIVWYRPV
jgi:hypothetical protein